MAKSISAPYGDIFFVNTPTLDQLSNRMYQEQKMREAKQQQEGAMLDANIQKELGRIRSVDTPDVIQAYNDYKQGKKQLLFDRRLQNDPLAYNQLQQKVLQDYQKIFTIANGSSELKEFQKQKAADISRNPNAHDDNAGAMLGTLMQTPYSQARSHPAYGDLTNPDTYTYKGSNTDWSKIVNDAAGKMKKMEGQTTVVPGGLQTSTPVYEFGNTPAQIKDNILGSMAVHQTGRDAAYTWDHIPEADIEKTIKDFQAIPKEDWQKMGLQGPQDIMPKNPDNKAENLASYYAMKHFIANRPRLVDNKLQDNRAAIMQAQEAKDRRMQAIRHADAKDLIQFKKDIDPNDTELNNVWYQSYLDNVNSDAKNSGERHHIYNPSNGKSEVYYNMVKPDPFLLKSFSIGNATPDRVGVTESGEIIPIFMKYDSKGNLIKTKNGAPVLDENYSNPMSYDQALVNLGFRGSTKKQLKADQQKLQNGKKPPVTKHNDPLGLF